MGTNTNTQQQGAPAAPEKATKKPKKQKKEKGEKKKKNKGPKPSKPSKALKKFKKQKLKLKAQCDKGSEQACKDLDQLKKDKAQILELKVTVPTDSSLCCPTSLLNAERARPSVINVRCRSSVFFTQITSTVNNFH